MMGAPSTRTHQRVEQVMQVPELADVSHGWKPAQCEWVLTNPPVLCKFLRDFRKAESNVIALMTELHAK